MAHRACREKRVDIFSIRVTAITVENVKRKGKIYSVLRAGINVLPHPVRQIILARIIYAQSDTVKQAIKALLDELEIDKTVQRSSARFQALQGKKNLNVHLGCGDDIRAGWLNIDLKLGQLPQQTDSATQSDTNFINYDLRRALPLEDNCCSFIYSSHFFEHLEYKDGLRLMRECYRVLQPEGIFRVSLPNFKGFFAAYLRGDKSYIDMINIHEVLPEVEPGTETYTDYVNYGVYQYGEHKCIYDEEKVVLLLQKLGFRAVTESSYQDGIDPASELRRRYSFYVEGVK